MMEEQTNGQHGVVRQTCDDVQSDGRCGEGMARMALYHRHCQDPVIFELSTTLEAGRQR